VSGAASATFVYDGDGNRVKGTVGATTTSYVGTYFEWTGSTSTMVKYYYHGGKRVSMRVGASTWYFLLTDHLTSTAITATNGGSKSAELRYKAWGENRYSSGTTPTTYRFTGQREEGTIGLYFYNARWYDAALARFAQADTIVPEPGNPQALNRYAYTLNNPVKYTDPTGHANDPFVGGRQREWWESPTLQAPSIYDIVQGGDYRYGQIPLGDRMVSVYLPPTVRSYRTQDGLLPLADSGDSTTAIVPQYHTGDYWHGEEVPGRNTVQPNSWETVLTLNRTERPQFLDALAGAGAGLGNTPDSLPLSPGATNAETRAEAWIVFAYAAQGALGAGWQSQFSLQQRVGGSDYRMIILTGQISSQKQFYGVYQDFLPYTPGPVIRPWTR
jgi:RHS repeat-associated protein